MNILFDLDGTLTDPKEGIVACIRHALATLGHPVPEAPELVKFIGPPLQSSFRGLLHSDERVAAAMTAYRERFSAIGMFENSVYDGIPETLIALAGKGARLFVATSKPQVFAERILHHFDLAASFEAVYGSELDGQRSDKTDLIAYALKRSRLAAKDTTMVGDRCHDMVGARSNGVRPVGVLWGYGSRAELTDAGAEKLFEAPNELARHAFPVHDRRGE